MNAPLSVQPVTAADHPVFFRLMQDMHPHLTETQFLGYVAEMRAQGTTVVGAFRNGAMCGVAGYRILTRFFIGKTFDLDGFAVDPSCRGQGIGAFLLEWLEQEAARLGCTAMVLDAYVHNADAHRFYFRYGFHIKGFHFFKAL